MTMYGYNCVSTDGQTLDAQRQLLLVVGTATVF